MIIRLIATALVLIAIIFLPYWIYLPLLFIALVIFRTYWEGIFLAFLVDTLYTAETYQWLSFSLTFALLATFIVIILIPLREHLRFNV